MSYVIAASTAGQFIPADNFRNYQRQPRRLDDFTPFLTKLCDWLEWENKADETRRHRKWVKAHMYYEGRQLGRIGRDGNWRDVNPQPTDPYFIDNKYRFFAHSVRKEWIRSSAEYQARGRGGTREGDGAARAARAIMQAELERIWTPFEKQREATFAILTGNYFRYTFFNPNKGQVIQIPQFGTQPVMIGHEATQCYDCQNVLPSDGQATPPDQMACPNCGSPNVDPINGQMVNVPMQTGSTPQMSGLICSEVVDPMEIKLHLHSRHIWDSPYVRRKRLVLRDVIENLYPWTQFEEGNHTILSGIWYQNELERSPGNATGTGRSTFGEGTAAHAA